MEVWSYTRKLFVTPHTLTNNITQMTSLWTIIIFFWLEAVIMHYNVSFRAVFKDRVPLKDQVIL